MKLSVSKERTSAIKNKKKTLNHTTAQGVVGPDLLYLNTLLKALMTLLKDAIEFGMFL
jgi:hypothetical protein